MPADAHLVDVSYSEHICVLEDQSCLKFVNHLSCTNLHLQVLAVLAHVVYPAVYWWCIKVRVQGTASS